MKNKIIKWIILCFFIIMMIYSSFIIIQGNKNDLKVSGKKEIFNANYFQGIYSNPPAYSSLTVGKWYYFPLTSGGYQGPVYKLDSSHILMIRGNSLDLPQSRSLYYYSVSGSSATIQKNATLTINGNPYATNASGQVYPTNGNHYTVLGDYIVNIVALNDQSGAANSIILKQREWVKGTSWWRYYDAFGMNSNGEYAGFPIANTPASLTSVGEGNYTENNVTRKINKLDVNESNASVSDYPFTIDISSRTTYKFWYGENHTEINEDYINDSKGRHSFWAEYNNKVDPPESGQPEKYRSGNVGADVCDVGTYTINDGKRDKKVIVNMRITFFWQTCTTAVSYNVGNYTFNTYPSVIGIALYPKVNSIGFLLYGFPYRANVRFFYYDENGEEVDISLNGCIGFNDIDAGQYLGFKVNNDAIIDELQCINNSYSWLGTSGDTGHGSMNYLGLGREAIDGSGVYDVIGSNIYQNAELITPRAGTFNSHINYPFIASNDGPESMANYTISNLNSFDLVVGGSKKNEAGVKYFNNIFDIPNNNTQVFGDIDTIYIDEYAMQDNIRDGLENSSVNYGSILIKGVKIGKNIIPSPTIMLKDEDENEASKIVVDKSLNSTNLSNYTEVISVKVPFENKIETGDLPYDNYYDSFKIEQTLDENVHIEDVEEIFIHYYGEDSNLSSNFTITADNNKLTIVANSGSNPIYKSDDFYLNELLVEVQLTLPNASSSIWNTNINSFSHTASITVTRDNHEFSGVPNEDVTNVTQIPAIANVFKAIVSINKDDNIWERNNIRLALFQNNEVKYTYDEGILINNGAAIRWIGVKEGVYDIYASKTTNELLEMVNTNKTISVVMED